MKTKLKVTFTHGLVVLWNQLCIVLHSFVQKIHAGRVLSLCMSDNLANFFFPSMFHPPTPVND